MTAQTKSRILIAAIIVAVVAAAAMILLLQPASEKAAAAEEMSATATTTATASPSAPAGLPNISAANPGQVRSNQEVAVPPDQARATDLPGAATSTTEQYRLDAEKAGNEFLKIYFNSAGSDMATPLAFVDKLAPYGTQELLDGIRESSGTATEWGGFGKFLHDKKLNFRVASTCSLAPGQAFAPVFDEVDGGNMPCSFNQTVVGPDGNEYKGDDLGVRSKSSGSQSLKMVKEDGAWKVAAFDSYGQ